MCCGTFTIGGDYGAVVAFCFCAPQRISSLIGNGPVNNGELGVLISSRPKVFTVHRAATVSGCVYLLFCPPSVDVKDEIHWFVADCEIGSAFPPVAKNARELLFFASINEARGKTGPRDCPPCSLIYIKCTLFLIPLCNKHANAYRHNKTNVR